ncbi:MAG TPA: ATP-binding protein [Geothrix sp.]|nr:ATP-binding protein [Geothrix sp.]
MNTEPAAPLAEASGAHPKARRAKLVTSRSFLVLFSIWSMIVATFIVVILYFSFNEYKQIALARAVDSYHKDLVVRRWASERGGVYVPLDEKTPPNPYLAHRPDRDLTTTDGKRLTLVNPAYMTRMVHELGQETYGLRGHITSLNPIRPENAPDEWERKALESFASGTRNHFAVVTEKDQRVLRYMGAFLVEKSCLACHAHQGYKVGDVRGGVSVTVPLGHGLTVFGISHQSISILTVLAFWAMGGTGIYLWVRRLARSASEQHLMMEELEESTVRFRLLFDSSPAPLVIHRAGRILHANAAASHLLEAAEPRELIGREVLELVHPGHREPSRRRTEEVPQGGRPTPSVEELFITLKGREVWAEVQSVPLDLPGGPAVLMFAQDLTERRKAEEERRKLETEVQHAQKLESLGGLAGGIAHDMNNVLSAILGMASLLQAKHGSDPALAKSFKVIETAAGRGRDLVKGLTDFARKGLQEPERMDLNALVQKELELLIRTSRQRFTFDVHLEEGLPPIMGESSTLASAIMNLCVNAFDAMPRGGTLSISTRLEGDQVSLLVADTGEGIPAEILPRVTEPFFTTKPAGRGTGLGLAMVYGTVKAHGGTLAIQSQVGQGTQITLRFPASRDGAAAPDAAALPVSAAPQASLRILVVDDDELIRSILPDMLSHMGHRVDTATGGLDALQKLNGGLRPDLVILDHNMPGMSGADALPRILQVCPDVQVLVATGFLDTELKLLLADFPSVLALQKPFSLVELRKILGRIQAGRPT